jgi:ankyrin repeat protein
MKWLATVFIMLSVSTGAALAGDMATGVGKVDPMELLGAIADRDTPTALALLQAGVDPNAHDGDNRTALMYAAASGQLEIMKGLLAQRADPNLVTPDGTTALISAVLYGDPKGVELLLLAAVNVNARDAKGLTALTYAQERLRIAGPGKSLPEVQSYSMSKEYQAIIVMLKKVGAKE